MMQDPHTPPPEVQRPTARPPAGAGANRWDRQRLLDAPFLFHQLMAQAQFKREAADPTPTRTRKRKPTLAGVARQAAKAGVQHFFAVIRQVTGGAADHYFNVCHICGCPEWFLC